VTHELYLCGLVFHASTVQEEVSKVEYEKDTITCEEITVKTAVMDNGGKSKESRRKGLSSIQLE